MPKVEINGRIVEFEKMPTEQDIDEVAIKLGISKTPQAPAEPQGVGGLQGFGVGLVKSGLRTLRGMGELGTKALQQTAGRAVEKLTGTPKEKLGSELYRPDTALGKRTKEAITARGGAEKFGKFVGDTAQFIAPTSKLVALEKGVGLLGRMAIEGLASGGIMAAQTGEVGKEAGVTAGIAALVPGVGAAYQGAKHAVPKILEKPLSKIPGGASINKALQPSDFVEKSANKIIDESIKKGIRPSVAGKGTFSQSQKYFGKARNAVKTILENKQALNIVDDDGVKKILPTSLNEFGQAIQNTKRIIFSQYDDLTKSAGGQGVKVDLAPIANGLDEVINSQSLKIVNPRAVEYAANLKSRLMTTENIPLAGGRGAIPKPPLINPSVAQDVIAHYNASLNAFHKNPNYDTASIVAIDSMVANNLRKSLDDVIENASAPGYQALKNKYGALKTIEKEVIHRAIVDARKNVKGLIDFSDFLSGGQVINGIVTMNSGLIAQGAAQKGITSIFKKMNDPNRIVQKMFQEVDNLYMKAVPENLARTFREGAKQQSVFKKTTALTEKISKFDIEGLKNYNDLAKRAKEYFGKDFNSQIIQNWLKSTKQLFDAQTRTGIPARIFGSQKF